MVQQLRHDLIDSFADMIWSLDAGEDALHFPHDDGYAWEILLHWIVPGQPQSADAMDCIKAWVLGEKYDIPEFQDCVMMELLRQPVPAVDIIRYAFEHTESNSKLRKSLAMRLVTSIHDDKRFQRDDPWLRYLGNIPGLFESYVEAQKRFECDKEGYSDRLDQTVNEGEEVRQSKRRWTEFLVDRRSKLHWRPHMWQIRVGEDGQLASGSISQVVCSLSGNGSVDNEGEHFIRC